MKCEVNVNEFKNQGQNAIQYAIEACAKQGGGTVIVEGEWEAGAIHLRSNIHLKLENEAIIRFSEKFEDYLPVVFTRWEGTECYNYSPLIYANNCENISITGNGTLIGNGQAWWHWKQLQQEAANELVYAQLNEIPAEERVFGTEKAALRPSFIQPINCKNILFEGFKIVDGPMWMIHPVYCEDVIVKNVEILANGPNTDGLNPDSCKNVLIDGCIFDTGDDCIAINSGMNEDGWRTNKPCEDITIRHCVMNGGHGAIVIGSGVSGGIKNIYAHDCVINNTKWGVRLKSMRGRGGYVDGAKFENIVINNARISAVTVNMFYEFSTVLPKTVTPSDFKNIEFLNISGTGHACGIELKGLPEHKLKNISFNQINLEAIDAFSCSDVEEINLENMVIRQS